MDGDVPPTDDPRNVDVVPHRTASLAPGRFGAATVASGGTLALRAGVYYFERLEILAGARVLLNQDAGPIIIYVREALAYAGRIESSTADAPDVLLG